MLWERLGNKVGDLSSLATLPAYQGREAATHLVRWGLDQARADADARPELIKGACTVAPSAGLATYKKCGISEVGEVVHDIGKCMQRVVISYPFSSRRWALVVVVAPLPRDLARPVGSLQWGQHPSLKVSEKPEVCITALVAVPYQLH